MWWFFMNGGHQTITSPKLVVALLNLIQEGPWCFSWFRPLHQGLTKVEKLTLAWLKIWHKKQTKAIYLYKNDSEIINENCLSKDSISHQGQGDLPGYDSLKNLFALEICSAIGLVKDAIAWMVKFLKMIFFAKDMFGFPRDKDVYQGNNLKQDYFAALSRMAVTVGKWS